MRTKIVKERDLDRLLRCDGSINKFLDNVALTKDVTLNVIEMGEIGCLAKAFDEKTPIEFSALKRLFLDDAPLEVVIREAESVINYRHTNDGVNEANFIWSCASQAIEFQVQQPFNGFKRCPLPSIDYLQNTH